MKNTPELIIEPSHSNIDEPISIVITGCKQNSEVTLVADMKDDRNEPYYSEATFLVDQTEKIDLEKMAPIRGSYDCIDVHGLLWSAKHRKRKHDDYFLKTKAEDLTVKFSLKINKKIHDQKTITRGFYQDEIVTTIIKEQGTVGTLYSPKSKGDYPNVLLLAGSDGGLLSPAASLLASKGFNVLDLAYFNQEGVSKELQNIPLEYFIVAVQKLRELTKNPNKVALIGYSRGAELALLLASQYNQFFAVIAGAPGAYITSGLKNSIYAPVNSWTLEGEPLPYLKFRHQAKTMFPILKNWILRKPSSFLSIWDESIKKMDDFEQERIKVENILSPTLLLSGSDDQIWPAFKFAESVEQKNPELIEHITFNEGEHFVAFPYSLPTLPSNTTEYVGAGMIMSSGGTKKINADASLASWSIIKAFLFKHVNLGLY